MSIFTRPVLQINLNNLVANYKKLREIAAPAVAAAVVKDNAYGLGAEMVAEALYNKADCRNFFVAHAVEGSESPHWFRRLKYLCCKELAMIVGNFLKNIN